MRKGVSTERTALTEAQLAQLRALDGRPDTADIPEAPAANWKHARPQSEINRILREKMEAED